MNVTKKMNCQGVPQLVSWPGRYLTGAEIKPVCVWSGPVRSGGGSVHRWNQMFEFRNTNTNVWKMWEIQQWSLEFEHLPWNFFWWLLALLLWIRHLENNFSPPQVTHIYQLFVNSRILQNVVTQQQLHSRQVARSFSRLEGFV